MNQQRISNFTRYAPPSIELHPFNNRTSQDKLKDKGDPIDIIVLLELLGKHILPLANLIGSKLPLDDYEDEPEQEEVQREVRPFSSGRHE